MPPPKQNFPQIKFHFLFCVPICTNLMLFKASLTPTPTSVVSSPVLISYQQNVLLVWLKDFLSGLNSVIQTDANKACIL